MIGDVLTSTVICENLRHVYPDCKVHFVAHENTLAVVANNPFIDRIIVFKNEYRESKRSFYGFLKGIKKEQYYAVIDAYGKLESNLIALYADATYKISHYKWYTSWIYTHTIKENLIPNEGLPLAIQNRLQLLNPILGSKNEFITYPKIYLTIKEMEYAAKRVESIKTSSDQKLIMISILGSSPLKTYPPLYMAELLDTICAHTNAMLLFNYVPNQEKEAQAIYDLCSATTKEQIKFDFHPTSLRDFIALLSQCSTLIGNEGGAVNMAKALDVPTFCVYSPIIIKGAWHSQKIAKHVGISLNEYKPNLFEGVDKKQIKKHIGEFYEAFKPTLFKESLQKFLREYCN
ncbi:MAG: lipopolysaccharide heptosyltransferase family protein [Maribacter sp.]|nr:lipopolysaccharide heptosyltransferase family protein [Maribacter sp.]